MTAEELKQYCLSEIERLKQEKALYEAAVNLRLGGIASYEDIIRRIDGVPDPKPTDTPNSDMDRAG